MTALGRSNLHLGGRFESVAALGHNQSVEHGPALRTLASS